MSGKYVPPSKRSGYKPATVELPPGHRPRRLDGPTHVIADVEQIFDTRQQGTFNYFSWRMPHDTRRNPERLPYDPTRKPEDTPLPPSPPPPIPRHPLKHLVAYIMIFGKAHPLWESNAELWSHTDSDILIEDEKGLKDNFNRPIPVFASQRRDAKDAEFQGWWMLDKMRIVPPNSEEVTDLHLTKQRFKGPNNTWLRTAFAWQTSLSCTWIKTRFVRVNTSDPRFADLPTDPFSLSPGEGAKLVLGAAGMEDELRILEEEVPITKQQIEKQRREVSP